MYMYIHTHIYIYIYIYVHAHIYIYIYIYKYIYMYIRMYVCKYTYVCICVYIYIKIHMYTYIYIYMYTNIYFVQYAFIYLYIHIYTCTWKSSNHEYTKGQREYYQWMPASQSTISSKPPDFPRAYPARCPKSVRKGCEERGKGCEENVWGKCSTSWHDRKYILTPYTMVCVTIHTCVTDLQGFFFFWIHSHDTLQHIATHCIKLHQTAIHCNTLQLTCVCQSCPL